MENNELGIKEVRAFVFEIINGMSKGELWQLLKELEERKNIDRRKHSRKDFFMTVDYIVENRYFQDFIQDMSNSGVFIKTSQTFSEGQMILMTFLSPDNQQPFKINGEIIRVHTDGIGVKFKIESQVQESVLKSYVNMIKRS
jgi:Tfp pilus assembly protein PilZ